MQTYQRICKYYTSYLLLLTPFSTLYLSYLHSQSDLQQNHISSQSFVFSFLRCNILQSVLTTISYTTPQHNTSLNIYFSSCVSLCHTLVVLSLTYHSRFILYPVFLPAQFCSVSEASFLWQIPCIQNFYHANMQHHIF